MVLELLDRIWSTRRKGTKVGAHRRMAIRRAVAAVRPRATRTVLDEMLHLAVPGADPTPEALQALNRYAVRLQYESEFRLASHVYAMVIDYATQIDHHELVPEAYRGHGRCMAERGDARAAMASYAAAMTVATQRRDKREQIRIAIAQSALHRARGNPNDARKLLDPLLRRARTLGDEELQMRAGHERGLVSHLLDDEKEALLYYAEAFRHCDDAKHRGRLLNDIALSLQALGYGDDARNTWFVSWLVTTGDSGARWTAGINLLQHTHARGDETGFDQYRRALGRAPMPARLLVAYWLEVGYGSIVFDRPSDAAVAFNRAARYAARYGYLEKWKEAKRALRGQLPVRQPQTPPASLPAAAADLLTKVRALRSLPGLLGRAWSGDANATPVASLRTALPRGRRPRSVVT
jgi:tetratricopeptide (TPR) repeat protein